MSPKVIATGVEFVTPARAAVWLNGSNGYNRPLKPLTVQRYAQEMERGAWIDNGAPIVFDEVGQLLDGQHRLKALVETGTSREFVIVRGAPVDAFTTFDVGTPRSLSDILSIRGYLNTKSLQGVALGAWRIWKKGAPWPLQMRPNHADLLRLLEAWPSLMEANSYTCRTTFTHVAVRRPYLAVAYDIAMFASPEDGEYFFDHLMTGESLGATSPILQLRNRLIQYRTDPMHRTVAEHTIWALTAKAWNAYLAGEPIANLRWRRGGAAPEAIPEFEGIKLWTAALDEATHSTQTTKEEQWKSSPPKPASPPTK